MEESIKKTEEMNRISLAEGKRVLYNKNVPEKEFFLEHYLDEKERMNDDLDRNHWKYGIFLLLPL